MNEQTIIDDETREALIDAVEGWIGDKEKIEGITLHGSRVFGSPKARDWDVVVWVKRPVEGHNEKFDWEKRDERIFQGQGVDLRIRSMDDWDDRQIYPWTDGRQLYMFELPLIDLYRGTFEEGKDQDAFLEAKAEHVRQVLEQREKDRLAGLEAKRQKRYLNEGGSPGGEKENESI